MSISNYKEVIKTVRINGLEIDDGFKNGKFIKFFQNHDFFNYFSHHISHKIFHLNYKKNYFSFNSSKVNNKQFILRIYNKLLILLKFFKSFFLLFKIYEKKKIIESELIFFTNHRISNENSIFPITNLIDYNKKNYIVLYETSNQNKISDYSKIYNQDKLFNLNRSFSLNYAIFSLLFVIKNFDKILLIKRNTQKVSLFYLSLECCKSRYKFLKYKSIIKKINIKKIFVNYSSGKEFFICAAKEFNNSIEIYGYALHGVSFSNQSLTSHYLFNHIDKLFLYGKADHKHFLFLKKKNKYFSLPRQFFVVGSVRDYLAFNKNKYSKLKNKNENKILYIKSNPNMLNDIDGKYCYIFFECLKMFRNNKIALKLKERDIISECTKNLFQSELIKKNDLIFSEFSKTEDLISENNYIVGTYSTSFIYQTVFLNKVLIQLGSQEIFWANLEKFGFCVANNKKEINDILDKIYNNKFDYHNYLSKQSLLKNCLIFNNGNPIDLIIKNICT